MSEKPIDSSSGAEYISLDYAKFAASLLIICIHLHPFASINGDFSYFFEMTVCRIGVPFFFMVSGFFLYEKIQDKKYISTYIRRLLKIYFIYSILYFPQNALRYCQSEDSLSMKLLSILRELLITGTYAHLWYILAVIAAVVLLYIMINVLHLSAPIIMVFSVLLCLVGIAGNGYEGLFLSNSIIRKYFNLFETTRNGVFFGFPFVFWGYWIKAHENALPRFPYGIFLPVFLLMSCLERREIKELNIFSEGDLMFSVVPLSIFFFLTILSVKLPASSEKGGIILRKLSGLIYGLHLLVMSYLGVGLKIFGLTIPSHLNFCAVTGVTLLLSVIILKLKKARVSRHPQK